MARYYVGLDFGTHQSKICIKDTSSNPESFSFLEFENGSVLFPSLVQISKDNRVTYGIFDDHKCKETGSSLGNFEDFADTCPTLQLPPKPLNVKARGGKFNGIKTLLDFKERKNVRKSYETLLNEWVTECSRLKKEHEINIESWVKRKEAYESRIRTLKGNNRLCYRFRYFKLAYFNEQYSTRFQNEYAFEGKVVSQWYLTYLLFKIEERIGSGYVLQMGIPSGIDKSEFEKQKNKAYDLLISAYEMMQEFKSLKNFLKADFRELLTYSTLKNHRDIYNYPFNVMPEAYSSLQYLAKNGKLRGGIYLLVDIGGGTTDIALFNINLGSKEPTIYSIRSIPLGLNNVFENYIELSNSTISIDEAQSMFQGKNKSQHLIKSIDTYHIKLLDQLNIIKSDLEKSFQRNNTARRSTQKLWDAVKFQVKVFSGGGSMNSYMTSFNFMIFKDSLTINKDIIAHNSIFTNKPNSYQNIFPILSNAYGLTEFNTSEIQAESMNSLFSHLREQRPPKIKTKNKTKKVTSTKYWRYDASDDFD